MHDADHCEMINNTVQHNCFALKMVLFRKYIRLKLLSVNVY